MGLFASLTVALSALSALVVAVPNGYGNAGCLSQTQAETLVHEYAAVIAQQPSDLGGPTKTARLITAPGYQEYSDSANQQIGIPVLQ